MTPYELSAVFDLPAGLGLNSCRSYRSQPVTVRSRCVLTKNKCWIRLTCDIRGVQAALLQKITRERVGEELDKMMGGTIVDKVMNVPDVV